MMFIVPSRGIGSTECLAFDEAGSCTAYASDSVSSTPASTACLTASGDTDVACMLSALGSGGSVPSNPITVGSQTVSGWSGSSSDLAAVIKALSTAAASATTAFNATQSPSVIPGTNLVYSPSTGKITNAVGVTVGSLGAAASTTLGSLNINTVALVGLGILGVIVLATALKGR